MPRILADAYSSGIIRRIRDRLSLPIRDRVGDVGKGQDGGLRSDEAGKSACDESLGEHHEYVVAGINEM